MRTLTHDSTVPAISSHTMKFSSCFEASLATTFIVAFVVTVAHATPIPQSGKHQFIHDT